MRILNILLKMKRRFVFCIVTIVQIGCMGVKDLQTPKIQDRILFGYVKVGIDYSTSAKYVFKEKTLYINALDIPNNKTCEKKINVENDSMFLHVYMLFDSLPKDSYKYGHYIDPINFFIKRDKAQKTNRVVSFTQLDADGSSLKNIDLDLYLYYNMITQLTVECLYESK